MTGQLSDAYSRRLTALEYWLKQPDNLAKLTAACTVHKVRPQDTAHILSKLVSATNRHTMLAAQSIQQLTAVTLIPEHTVRRALKALETAGALSTVYKGRPAADGKGKPSARKVLFLTGDNSDENAKTVHSDMKDRALDSERPCTQVHATSIDIASIDTTTGAKVSAETETEKGKGAHSEPDWSSLVTSAITQLIVSDATGIKSPDGFRYHTLSKVRKAVYAVETDYGAGIRQISPATYGWSDLVMVVQCRLQGEAVSRATSEALQKTADTALTT